MRLGRKAVIRCGRERADECSATGALDLSIRTALMLRRRPMSAMRKSRRSAVLPLECRQWAGCVQSSLMQEVFHIAGRARERERMQAHRTKTTPLAQSVEVAHQRSGGAKDLYQQIDHLVVEQKRVRQVFAASQAYHFQIGCRRIVTHKAVRHSAQRLSRDHSVWEPTVSATASVYSKSSGSVGRPASVE